MDRTWYRCGDNTERIFIYFVRLPEGFNESVEPCFDGYTVYIEETLSDEAKIRAYDHAMRHIDYGDFFDDLLTTSQKEFRAHNL